MALGEVEVVETFSRKFEQICDLVDEVVVGGGPLMDIEALNHMLYSFMRANKSQAVTRIEGCGIGPLVEPLYVQVVAQMMRLADVVTLRDEVSTERCVNQFLVSNVQTVPDPATDYVNYVKSRLELANTLPILGEGNNVSCFLREWGRDYAGSRNSQEYVDLKLNFERELTKLITSIARTQDLEVHLLPMHTFQVGGDDRVFNRRLAKDLANSLPESKIHFARSVVSPEEILQSMYSAKFNICMRFHSVLFAETLNVPYLAIDYTGGGKIKAFLAAKGQLDRLISLEEVAAGKWSDKIAGLLQFSEV
jgi:polysaccharide pyruvyl transferase WcaK-like protein